MKQQFGPSQILRDSVPVVDLERERRTTRSWLWVCSALVGRDKGECCINLVESVFLNKQQIWSWYFSDNGIVRRRPQSRLTAEQVHRAFVQVADEFGAAHVTLDSTTRPIAVCWFDKNDTPGVVPFLTASDLLSFLQSISASSVYSAAISTFIRPRGELDCYANLEHQFTLQKSGRVRGKLFWLALGGQRIASKDSKLNTTVNEVVQHYISFLEKNKKCRVARCVSLFIMEDSGKLHLWRTSMCETISAAVNVPSAPTFPDALVSSFSSSYDGPRAMNERLLARARAEGSRVPDERLVEAIMAAPTPHSNRTSTRILSPSASTRLDPLGEMEGRRRANLELRNSSDWDDVLAFLPATSSLSRGRRRTVSAAHLMSSQKRGCCGDFCRMSIAELTAQRMERKKESTLREQVVHARKGRRRTSAASATATASAFMEAHRADELLDRLAEQRKPSSPQRMQRVEAIQPPPLTHTIPFKLVAQTRAEKQLVDLFIRRYQCGEDGDYLAEAYYGDGEPLGFTFPGYYYRDVQVCVNCYEFYMLVEKVRMKALDQIARREKTSPSRRSPEKNTFNSQNKSIEQLREEENEDGDDDDNNDKQSDSSDNLQHVWKHVWAQTSSVAAAITKKDAAELYSFVNPHPAVAMVLSGLGALLLGSRGGDWGEVKRAISQDKLLSRLHRVDLEALSESAVMQAAAHARNPLFTPSQIAPISSCAARFCDWIRTVLQAYAWKQRLQMQDSQTRRMLCFLKPEMLPPGVVNSQLEEVQRDKTPVKKIKTNEARIDETLPKSRRQTQQKQAARRAIQAQQMARLAAPSGIQDGVVGTTANNVFTCQDGVTQMPYTVIGQPVGETIKCNLVVFHDLFDTLESTTVFFRPIVARNMGARVLLFNFPGQA
ncbi:hypothetical protein PHPALM_32050, partial [Phytophthora palmivora]